MDDAVIEQALAQAEQTLQQISAPLAQPPMRPEHVEALVDAKLRAALSQIVPQLQMAVSSQPTPMARPGRDGKDGVNGRPGRDGRDGKDGKDIVRTLVRIPDTTRLAEGDGSSLVGYTASGTATTSMTVQDKGRRSINLFDVIPKALWSGIEDGTNTTDLTSYIQQAITNYQGRRIVVPHGKFRVNSSLTIAARGYSFEGEVEGRVSLGGAEFDFRGTGACFEIGTDDSGAWDANTYDGMQDQFFQNIWISHGARDTNLNHNSANQYKASAYGFRDWRGGGIRIKNCGIEGFEYNWWGIQSDLNVFERLSSFYSRYGLYIGPRSDQTVIQDLMTFYCDNAVVVDKAADVRFVRANIIGNGDATRHAVLIKQGSGLVVFEDPWFEHLQGYTGTDQLAFVGAGTEAGYGTDTNAVRGVYIINPFIYTAAAAAQYHTQYLVEVGKCRDVRVEWPQTAAGASSNMNLDQYIAFQSGTSYTAADSRAWFEGHDNDGSIIYVNNGSGTPEIGYQLWGNSGTKFGSANGRLYIERVGAAAGADEMFIGSENAAGAVLVSTPNYSSGQTTRMLLRRVINSNFTAAPTSGTWEKGDIVLTNNPDPGEIFGWSCTTGGTPGTWTPIVVLPSVASDRGDTDRTITAGTDAPTQRWATTLTADRAVTLSTTGVWTGAKFKIVRTAGGAFNLNVGTGPLKALAANTWCEVEYSGSAWILTAYGAL